MGTVQNYLVRLERQGVLRKTWNARRGVEPTAPFITSPQNQSDGSGISAVGAVPLPISLPLLGLVAAGKPIEAILDHETLEVPASMIKGGTHFVLKVSGNSMIEDGIFNGDYVVIKKQPSANNGQTVVALVGNEATIKRFYRRGSHVELHPANPAYQPLIIDSLVETREFKIEGVLVGLIRRYDTPS